MYPGPGGAGFYGTYGNLGLYGALVPYGSLDLTESSPVQSFLEPLTMSQVQEFLNLPDSLTTAQTATLTMFISAAREQAEILQGRDLVVKQWDLTFDYWPSYRVELRPKVISVDLAQYTDSAGTVTPLVANTDYVLDRSKQVSVLAPPYNKTWPTFTPWPTGAILIRFTAGISNDSAFWQDAGARVKVGMCELISLWFSNRLPVSTKVDELPYGVTSCLSYGRVPRVR